MNTLQRSTIKPVWFETQASRKATPGRLIASQSLTTNGLIILSLLLCSGCAIKATNSPLGKSFKNIHTEIQKIEKEMESFFEGLELQEPTIIGFKQSNPVIEENNDTVLISLELADVDDEKINLEKRTDKQSEYLLVEIPQPQQKTELTITMNDITSSTKQEVEEKTTQDNKQAAYYAFGNSKYMQILPSEVSLHDVKAEYNKDKKKLTITLQKIKPITAQKINIEKK